MSHADKDPDKKHRHDIGDVDHGPVYATNTTRTLQVLLAMWIVGSALITIYALLEASLHLTAS
ncbi:MAG: hypothetical protein Tsb0020_55100 [Haliangiales bacterium]